MVLQAAAPAEAAQNLLFDLTEQRQVLGEAGQVVQAGLARQCRRTVTRQGVDRTHRLVVHYVRHGHPRQPLTHITFFQPGSIGKLFTRRAGRGRQRVQQAGLMTDTHQQD
ncbi:Uncharacterised protein [Mycobacteroides abscessus subsp. massiliense]|nr:Uncharacterised protein [Mycobacteroides abscessus subsp. massiliense]